MEIREITDKQEWEDFVHSYKPNSMLQSWHWGEFEKKQDEKIFRPGLYIDGKLKGVAFFTKVEAKRGKYIVAHHAPLVDYDDWSHFEAFHAYAVQKAKQEDVHFVRIRPPLLHSGEQLKPFKDVGYRLAPMYFQAEHTIHVDLTKSEDKLMSDMRKNTRYGVRRAGREGVIVEVSQDRQEIDKLFKVYEETVDRQDFVPYDKQFFLDEFDAFVKDDLVDLFFAYYDGRLIGAAMIIYYDKTAFYHHSGSIRIKDNVYANYLLQWEIMKRAKERGCTTYDMWGVAPTDDEDHPRAGLTLFKRGFGGERVRWLHTLDYPIHGFYWLTYTYAKLERCRRRL